MATFEQWHTLYEEYYNLLPEDPHLPCPNCGYQALRLVYTANLDRMVGYGYFWCDNCLQGIGISRAPIPEGAVVRDIRVPAEDREPKVPDFTLVPPA